MRISVIMPCHNAAGYVAEALKSVAAQTCPPHEVIVVNDASTDGSAGAIRASGVGVRRLDVALRNAAAARNAGIEAATGDWIALLDADDRWYPNHLERAMGLLRGTPDVAFCANYDVVDADRPEVVVAERASQPESRTGLTHRDYVRRGTFFTFGHSTILLRRDRVLQVGGYDPQMRRRHDLDLWLRVIHQHTWTFDAVANAVYRRGVKGSLSSDAAEVAFYRLRVAVKNAPAYQGTDFGCSLPWITRQALSLALCQNDGVRARQAWALAKPHLAYRDRWRLGWLVRWPRLSAVALRSYKRLRGFPVPPVSAQPGVAGKPPARALKPVSAESSV